MTDNLFIISKQFAIKMSHVAILITCYLNLMNIIMWLFIAGVLCIQLNLMNIIMWLFIAGVLCIQVPSQSHEYHYVVQLGFIADLVIIQVA